MTKDDLQKLIAECNATEANLNQQLQQIVGQINRTVGAREMAQHLLSETDKPAAETKKRGRKKVADEATVGHTTVGSAVSGGFSEDKAA